MSEVVFSPDRIELVGLDPFTDELTPEQCKLVSIEIKYNPIYRIQYYKRQVDFLPAGAIKDEMYKDLDKQLDYVSRNNINIKH